MEQRKRAKSVIVCPICDDPCVCIINKDCHDNDHDNDSDRDIRENGRTSNY